MRIKWHSLAMLLAAIALQLQGCDDEDSEDEDKEKPGPEEGQSSSNSTNDTAQEPVWIGEHQVSHSYGGPPANLGRFDSKKGGKVEHDPLPGKGNHLLEAQRSYERALYAGTGAEQQVRHLEKEKHLEDHFASNPTPTSTTAPTKDGDSNETSTEDVFSNESTESDNDTNLTDESEAAGDRLAAKVGSSRKVAIGPARQEHQEELKIEQFKKLAPKVFHSAPAWIPQKESSKSKAVKRQSPAKQTSQDSERWESKPEESQAAKPEELQHSAEEAQELEGGHTKAEESQAPEEPQHTAEEAEDLESGHAKAEESQAPEEPQHTAEEAEELESGHAKAENRDAEEHQHSAERAPSEEPEDFEGTPKARESSEGEADQTGLHQGQDDMPKDDSVDALAEDDSGAEDEDFSHSSVMELRRKHHVHARKVDRIARLHRLHGLQREAMLELQLRQDQQLEELRQELERHRRHEDDELERFREREELEREQMRIDGESSAIHEMSHGHHQHHRRHGSRKMGHDGTLATGAGRYKEKSLSEAPSPL